MTLRIIYIGEFANDGTGDNLRTAFDKVNQNFIELYNLTGNLQAISVAADGNTLVKRDAEGDVFANKIYYSNYFDTPAALPAAADHQGMLVYVENEGFRASNGTEWIQGFGAQMTMQLNGQVIGETNKIKSLNFIGNNVTAAVDTSNPNQVNVSIDAAYNKVISTSTLGTRVIDSFSVLEVKAAKYLVHIVTDNNVYYTEINVLHNGIIADLTEYGSIGTVVDAQGDPVRPGEFNADINQGQVELTFTPDFAINVIRINRYAIIS